MTQEEKNGRYLKVIMAASVVCAAVLIVSFVLIVPGMMKTMEQAQTTMEQVNQMAQQMQQIYDGVTSISESVEGVVADGISGSSLGSLDVDSLNQSIQDLQSILEPLAKLIGK